MANDTTERIKQTKLTGWGLLIGIILIASNLRAPITSVGSLLSLIRDDFEVSNATAGMITTLPLLAFAILSPFTPIIANRIGMEWTIFYSFLLLTIGLIIRSLFGITFFFAGTIILGIAIAFGNVLLPAIIKLKFPLKIGLMTGLYAVFMNIFGALASGVSLPLSRIPGWGWQGSLAAWAILSFIALLVWIPQLKKKGDSPKTRNSVSEENHNIWRSTLAWNITIYMGTQSLVFYTFITWLPDIVRYYGFTSDVSGWLLSLMQFSFIPFTFIVPVVAEKMEGQKLLSVLTGLFVIIGVGGLFTSNIVFITIAVICIGAACGAAFSLSMMFFTLRSEGAREASRVSGMAQSFGYLIAAAGPVLLGALHDWTMNWVLPLISIGAIGFIMIITGFVSGRVQKITGTRV